MNKLFFVIFFCLCSVISFAQFSSEPKQLYTTTETQFGNQKMVTYPGTVKYPVYQTPYSSGPAKAPGDKWSGSSTETVDGQTVTVYWTVSAPGLGLVWWTITYTYPDGHTETEEYYGSSGNAKNKAQEEAREKARELAEEMAQSLPVGDVPMVAIILFIITYLLYDTFRDKKDKD